MSNGTLTDEKQGEDYQDYGMRHPPRISDWTLEDKILWTDLRRAAFEYAYMHRYFTADWDSGSPRQPGAPDRWRYDPEAANEAGRVTATGWDWKVPQVPAAPPADMSQLEEMKQILDQDRSPPSTVWDPRFDQETAYADANTYLAENIPGFTLELLDRLLVEDMGIEQDVMDWTEFRPEGPLDSNLLEKAVSPLMGLWKSTVGPVLRALTSAPRPAPIGLTGVSAGWTEGMNDGKGYDFGSLPSVGWEATESKNPLEPNPTQANRAAYVGEPGSGMDIVFPHNEIDLLIDLGLIFAGGPIARGVFRIPRLFVSALNRNSAVLSQRFSPAAINYLRKIGLIDDTLNTTVKGRMPSTGTGPSGTGLAPTTSGRTPDMGIRYRQTFHEDPTQGAITTQLKTVDPALMSPEQLRLEAFLHGGLKDIRVKPGSFPSGRPLPEGGIVDAPSYVVRDPFTQQALVPFAETATPDLAFTTGAARGGVTEDQLLTIASGDVVFSTAGADYRMRQGVLSVRDSSGYRPSVIAGPHGDFRHPSIGWGTRHPTVVYVSQEDAALLRIFWDKHRALPPIFDNRLSSTLDFTTLPEVGRVPVVYNQGFFMGGGDEGRWERVQGVDEVDPSEFATVARWKNEQFVQNYLPRPTTYDPRNPLELEPEAYIGEPITYVDPRAVNEIAQASGVLQQLPSNPVKREVANALARRNIETLLETAVPSWEDGLTLFHGTSHDYTNFDVGRTSESGLYGQGIYTTVDPRIAVSYRSNVEGAANFVHRVEWTGSAPPKILDVEAPLPAEVREALRPLESRAIEPADLSAEMDDAAASAGWGAPETVYSTIDLGLDDPTRTWMGVYNDWNGAHSYTTAGHDDIRQVLLDLGYDAMRHTGGIRAPGRAVGADPHEVVIWIDDANIKSGGRAMTTGFVSQEGDLMRTIVRSPEEAIADQTRYLGEGWESLTDTELAALIDRPTPALEPGYQGPPGPGGMTMAADIPVPPVGPEDALAFALGRTILPVRRIMSTHPLTALPHELQMPPPWGTSNVAKADAMVVFDRLEGGEVSHTVTPFLTAAEEAGIPVFNFREQHAATGGVEEMTAAALQDFLKANDVESLFVTGDTGWDTIGSRINHHLGLTFGNQFTPSQRALPELPRGVTMEVSSQFFTPELLRANPKKYYLFGENVKAHDAGSMTPGGPDSGAAIIRGQPNAIGIPTKSTTREYMTDDAYDDNIEKIDEGFAKIPEGGVVVVHQDRGGYTLGTGRADLRRKAPRTWDYLQARLDQLGSAGFGSSSGFSPSLYLPSQPAETGPAGWPTYKHFTTPEGKAGLIESGGIHDFTKPPAHGVGSGKGLGPRTERAGGDYLYLSLDDAHWGSYDVDTGVGVVIPNKWVLPDETGMSHGLPKPDTDPASVKKYYGSDITDRGHNDLMPGPNTWNYKLLEQEYQRIEAEGIETRGFYDYDAQEWRVEAGGAIRTELESVDYAIDPSARRLVIDSDESYRAALEEAESIGGQSVRLHDITPGKSGWEALEERYDIVEIRNVSEHLDGRWRKFWQAYGSDQIIVLNPDVARMVSSPETPTRQAASPGTPAETGPTDELSVLIREKGLFSEEEIADPVFREWIVLDAKTSRAAKSEIDEPFSPEAQAIWDDRKGWGVGEGLNWEAFSRARGYTEEEIADNRRWLELQNELAWREPHNQGVEPNQFGIVWSGDHPSEIFGPDVSDWPVMDRWHLSAYDDPLFDLEDPLSVPRPEYLTMEGWEAREAELVEMDFGIAAPLGTPAEAGPSVDFGEWTSQWTAATGSPPSATTVAHWKWLGTSPTVESATLRSDVSVRKIVSGAQSGADQGGLYAARDLGLETDGYMPSGFKTEKINEQGEPVRNVYELNPELGQMFGLREAKYSEYKSGKENIWPPRTILNANMADGTLWIGTTNSPGYKLTSKHSKNWVENPTEEVFIKWLQDNNIEVLNVAGNRASTEQGLFDRVRTFIVDALREPGSGGVSPSVPPGTPAEAAIERAEATGDFEDWTDPESGWWEKFRAEYGGESGSTEEAMIRYFLEMDVINLLDVQDIAEGVPIQTVLARKREAMSEEGVAELEEKLLPAASNVHPIVLQELERVRGKLIAFKTEHGYPHTAVYRTPGIRDYYMPTAIYDWFYTSAQLQAYDDIFPEHAGAGNRIIWLPDERNLALYQNLYGIKRKAVGAYIVQEIRRFDRLLTRYAELMGFTE